MNTISLAAVCCCALSLMSCSDSSQTIEDSDKLIAEMSQRVVATTQAEKIDSLIPRYNQPKSVACLKGTFEVSDSIPEGLQHGLFKEAATYPVMARFANATKWDDSEKDLRGLSLRVSDVEGPALWGEDGYQDFLFNSYPALFVATPEEFLDFMRARQAGGTMSMVKFFLSPFDPHIGSLITVLKARGKHNSPLDIRYWSTVPSALDSRLNISNANQELPTDLQAVKYSATPCSQYKTDAVVDAGDNQLRAAVKSHIAKEPACFEIGVQVQTDPESMPIEDASVIWDEDDSPYVTVATVMFEDQVMDDNASLEACEQAQFNPWQSLAQHTPLGRMNAVRKEVYATGAYLRATRN